MKSVRESIFLIIFIIVLRKGALCPLKLLHNNPYNLAIERFIQILPLYYIFYKYLLASLNKVCLVGIIFINLLETYTFCNGSNIIFTQNYYL